MENKNSKPLSSLIFIRPFVSGLAYPVFEFYYEITIITIAIITIMPLIKLMPTKKTIIKTIVIAASIISVYSIYQYIWGYQYMIDYLKKINSALLLTPPHNLYANNILIGKRAIGTFPSPNILGSYLLMAFFLALAISKNQVSHKRWLFAPPLIIIALMLTKSLGVWISFITIFIILFFISYNALKKHKVLLIISFAYVTLTILFIILGR